MLVLSYNISHEAMTNRSKGTAGPLGKKCVPVKGNPKLTICAQAMARTIDAIPAAYGVAGLDFVGLQEASRWRVLKGAAAGTLASMSEVHSQSNHSELASFYDSGKYELVWKETGEFKPDRPFHVLLCADKVGDAGVIFINVHCSHHAHYDDIAKAIHEAIKERTFTQAEQHYRVIVVGDFNETGWDWSSGTLQTRQWQPLKHAGIDTEVSIDTTPLTCCKSDGAWADASGKLLKGDRAGDYIFDSAAAAKVEVPQNYDPRTLQSDHLPVIALLP